MTVPARVVDTQTLTAAVKGTLVQPGDSTYDAVRVIWNAMIDRRPAVIVRCADAADVAAAIGFARERGLEISIRGGGHNIAGTSVSDGGVMIDLSQMRQVRVDAAARRAYVEPGALLADVDRATLEHGLATPLGINSTTGVAGLTLGGGFGWLTRTHGMTVDNLVSADVVGADGTMRRASATENPDLFWALRGGGGNFGVVTQFEFALHPIPPQVVAGLLVFPMAHAGEILRQYRTFVERAPESLNVWAVLRKAPPLPFLPAEVHGQGVVVLAVFSAGDPVEAAAQIDVLRAVCPAARRTRRARRRTAAGSRPSIRCSRPARATTGSRTTSPSWATAPSRRSPPTRDSCRPTRARSSSRWCPGPPTACRPTPRPMSGAIPAWW